MQLQCSAFANQTGDQSFQRIVVWWRSDEYSHKYKLRAVSSQSQREYAKEIRFGDTTTDAGSDRQQCMDVLLNCTEQLTCLLSSLA